MLILKCDFAALNIRPGPTAPSPTTTGRAGKTQILLTKPETGKSSNPTEKPMFALTLSELKLER